MKNIFAIISEQLGKRLERVQNKLDSIEIELSRVEADLVGVEGVKKMSLRARQSTLQDNFRKMNRQATVIYTVMQAVGFMDALFASFKNRWIPTVATTLLIMGPVSRGFVPFVTGTLVNLLIVVVLLCVTMYAFRGSLVGEKPKNMPLAKGIFLALVVEKVLYSLLGAGWMIAITVLAAVGIAFYIERDDLKALIQRWKNKK